MWLLRSGHGMVFGFFKCCNFQLYVWRCKFLSEFNTGNYLDDVCDPRCVYGIEKEWLLRNDGGRSLFLHFILVMVIPSSSMYHIFHIIIFCIWNYGDYFLDHLREYYILKLESTRQKTCFAEIWKYNEVLLSLFINTSLCLHEWITNYINCLSHVSTRA